MAWQVLATALLIPWLTVNIVQAQFYVDLTRFCNDSTSLSPCPQPHRGTYCHCSITENRDKARCCHVDLRRLNDELIECLSDKKLPVNLRVLFLSNCTADNDELNLKNIANWFPEIESISLNNGDYTSVNDQELPNGAFKNLKCLNISNNVIDKTDGISKIINSVPSLSVMDIAHNNLTYAPKLNQSRTDKLWLHMAGNPLLKCDGISEAIKKKAMFLSNETSCISQTTFDWFNSTDRTYIRYFEAIERMQEECPKPCDCKIERKMFSPVDKNFYYSVTVDCVGKNLQELPRRLPDKTHLLNISYNNISDLQHIISKNNNYEQLKILDADHNNITSIQILEGSLFLQQFEKFSLKYNNLQEVTLHVLNNAFERNWNSMFMFLGHNYIICDCSTFHNFRKWLIEKKAYIPDHDEIYCKDKSPVMALDDAKVCLAEDSFRPYMTYYLIGVEVALLLLLVSKVSYDYWVFKNAGYLPWPASKMPKLPCDCVLET